MHWFRKSYGHGVSSTTKCSTVSQVKQNFFNKMSPKIQYKIVSLKVKNERRSQPSFLNETQKDNRKRPSKYSNCQKYLLFNNYAYNLPDELKKCQLDYARSKEKLNLVLNSRSTLTAHRDFVVSCQIGSQFIPPTFRTYGRVNILTWDHFVGNETTAQTQPAALTRDSPQWTQMV